MIPLDRVRELLDGVPGLWVAERADALSAAAPDLARDVLTLADALETAERERDTARSAHAELAAAVREEREAMAHLTRARHRSARAWDDGADAENAARQAHYEADDAMREASARLDALLAAAPPRTTVDARVVRAYLRAEANCAEGDRASGEAMLAARAAVEAALAGCV